MTFKDSQGNPVVQNLRLNLYQQRPKASEPYMLVPVRALTRQPDFADIRLHVHRFFLFHQLQVAYGSHFICLILYDLGLALGSVCLGFGTEHAMSG